MFLSAIFVIRGASCSSSSSAELLV